MAGVVKVVMVGALVGPRNGVGYARRVAYVMMNLGTAGEAEAEGGKECRSRGEEAERKGKDAVAGSRRDAKLPRWSVSWVGVCGCATPLPLPLWAPAGRRSSALEREGAELIRRTAHPPQPAPRTPQARGVSSSCALAAAPAVATGIWGR